MDSLNVKTAAMKRIEREDKLEGRLSDKGYKLIEKKKEFKKGLMQQLLTGRIRVI